MSWIKKRTPSTPSPAPTPHVQMYNPNQHSTQENQWYNQQMHDNSWYNQPTTQQQQYNSSVPKLDPSQQQPPQPNYHEPNYPNNPQLYNQNTTAQSYGQPQQQQQPLYPLQQQQSSYYQNDVVYNQQQSYGNLQYNQQYNQNNSSYGVGGLAQQHQQQHHQPQHNVQPQPEGDAWNWGWGDEDNSNNVQMKPPQSSPADNLTAQAVGANVADSFTNDKSWSWGMDESTKQSTISSTNLTQSLAPLPPSEESGDVQSPFPTVVCQAAPSPTTKTQSTSPSSQDNNAAASASVHLVGKRGKLDTPQWSTESQISQESSDDIVQTSESDKSHISHSPLMAGPNHFAEEALKQDHVGQFENREIVVQTLKEEEEQHFTPPPRMSSSAAAPPADSNPYKRSTGSGLSHKASIKFRMSSNLVTQPTQNFAFQQVNLETLPDNSEQPDLLGAAAATAATAASSSSSTQPLPNIKLKSTLTQQWPDNNEAPINDRNQYLETGHLSELNSNDYDNGGGVLVQDVVAGSDALPPPGLRRMVPGQQGIESVSSLAGGDEPPPGLSRMVLGQTETANDVVSSSLGASSQSEIRAQFDNSGPPEGLHRMVPGESSSPESTLRHNQQNRGDDDDNDSDAEFSGLAQHKPQPRSATIGADTPPNTVTPLSMTSSLVQPVPSIVKGNNKVVDIDGGNGGTNRRESIEGQNRDAEVTNLAGSIRNLTVGENLTDVHNNASNNSLIEAPVRRHSRQESSESERDLRNNSRTHNRKSADRGKRDKERDHDKSRDSRERYSPDSYRDKKYDRRRYKDPHYEEDTDYYSDKEKDVRSKADRDRDREYERRYSSLRKDKDKDRRRRDPREYVGSTSRRGGDYYYGGGGGSRYDEDYDNEGRSSRPSSRSDSMHDSYRERGHEKEHRDRRHRERERERYNRRQARDPRDMYNPYQNLSYDPYNPYYQQYQYYENLRRTNPQAYAEWYRKYYQQATGQTTSSYGGEDRASVHSGRSSANDELTKDRYTRQSFYSQTSLHHHHHHQSHGGYYAATDMSLHSISGPYGLDASSYTRPFDQTDSSLNFEETSVSAQRLTPAKFATAHIKASIASGKLLRILPHYPMDGQNATVEICQLQSLLADDEVFLELREFPGPLTKGVTHKKTIIEYCENKIQSANLNQHINDVDSYILMWELLILLIRQNGMVVGTDIAELLLKNRQEPTTQLPRPSSVLSSISSIVGDATEASNNPNSDNVGSTNSVLKEEEVTNKFREFLLYGSGKEALEYAMKHGLWGHALFLASKLDKRTYANVMMRFANGLTLNDPLQTLYQLLSGKIPAAVTCVSDEKWGDWRPHLAMILSNSSQRPELNCKAITTLGDTLNYRGSLYAAQFCYLLAEVGFGKHDDPETRLVLLGADHRKPFPTFAANEAIHMTEIYEYACGLNVPNFTIPQFQIYKYFLATRLADRGLLEKSLSYLEKVSEVVIANPSSADQQFVDNVCRLADRLKFYDPVGEVDEDESQYGTTQLETSRPDHSWLKDLRAIQNDFQTGMISQQTIITSHQDYSQSTITSSGGVDVTSPLQQMQSQMFDSTNAMDAWQSTSQPTSWQQTDQHYQPPQQQQQHHQIQQQPGMNMTYSEQHDYSEIQQPDNNQTYWQDHMQQPPTNENQLHYNDDNIDQQQQQSYYENNAQTEPSSEVEKDTVEVQESPPPQITMPNQSQKPTMYNDEPSQIHENALAAMKQQASLSKTKPQTNNQEKTQSTGWFGGIFSKLALKPKNQMKLPDDKNPKIVWDQEKKRWVNVDEDTNDPANEFKPPPKMSDMMMMPNMASLPTANNGENVVSFAQPYATIGAGGNQPASLPANVNVSNSNVGDNITADNNGNALKPAPPNMFKLQKSRNLKNSYIDVFNPGGGGGGGAGAKKPPLPHPTSAPAPTMGAPQSQPPQMNFFIPQPVSDPNAPVDFLTPGGVPHMGEQQKRKTNE